MKITFENKINIGFILSLLAVIFIVIVSYLCINDLADDARRNKESQEVMTQLSALLSTISDAESAQRGYVISDDVHFLEMYDSARLQLSIVFQSLKELNADNQYQLKRITAIEKLIARRMKMFRANIEMRRTKGFELVQHEISTGRGRLLQNEIYNKVANMQHEENIIQIALAQNSISSIRFTKLVLILSSIVVFVFVLFSLFYIRRGFIERRIAEADLNIKNIELQRINSEKDKFFSIIAHDLRNPFNGFLGFTKLMVEDLPDMTREEIQKIALSMSKSATNLFSLLENLLEWSRMEQGLIPFKQELIELKPRVIESIKPLIESAKNKEIEIKYDLSGDLQVYADSYMLQSILRNLVSNAIKFTNKNGKIYISAKTTIWNSIEISITDSGVGMTKEMVDTLFQLGANTGRLGTLGEPSTGLGLLLCNEFVQKHGGKIWGKSEENKGSMICFTIPAGPEGIMVM